MIDKFSKWWRQTGFFMWDALHKNTVASFINELEQGHDSTLLQHKLEQILKQASTNTVYYQKYLGQSLASFPVITKHFLIQSEAPFRNNTLSEKQLIKVRTSGSYGSPFTFLLTKEKKHRQQAEVLFYGKEAGYEVGVKHAYVRSNPPKSSLRFWLQNEVFYAAKVMDAVFLENARKSLLQDKIKVIIGFATAITRIAQYCTDQGDEPTDFDLEGVISCSENLTAVQRTIIAEAFNCKVHNRYSTEELGVIGYQYSEDSGFEINTCNYIVELLNVHNDDPAPKGTIGRIIVTDLHSDAFPLIRYETGDLGVVRTYINDDNGWVKCLDTLSGREVQILQSTAGLALYPLYLDTIMEEFPAYMQYQLIQNTTIDFVFHFIPKTELESFSLNHSLLNEKLKNWLGTDATLTIKMVADLNQLPSGKRPYIINNRILS